MIQFDEFNYNHGCGTPMERNAAWLGLFGGIAEHIFLDIHPTTVLDAGCAMGFLVESLRKKGIQSFGIDISEYAIQNVHPDVRPYCKVGSITEAFPQRYDLIVSIEVLEHMPKEQAELAVQNICISTDDILFSSTPFDYKEVTHLNVQPPEYWVEQFARNGFFRDVDFDASFITPWAVRYRRSKEPVHRIVRAYERRFALLSKETYDLRALNYEMRLKLSADEQQIKASSEQIEALNTELSLIHSSQGWQLISKLRQLRAKLAPVNSRRDRIITRFLHTFKREPG
jgi:2-polyprenyl-3-methyl-5-hydroxy-6-metoxy-1,4-benzoquinol methylase